MQFSLRVKIERPLSLLPALYGFSKFSTFVFVTIYSKWAKLVMMHQREAVYRSSSSRSYKPISDTGKVDVNCTNLDNSLWVFYLGCA